MLSPTSTHLAAVPERLLDRLSDQQLEQLPEAWAAVDPAALEPTPDEREGG